MIEHVSFDTAQMSSDTNISKTDYQQGPLYNTNLRDFIFSKTNHKCSYCGAPAQEIDHIVPRAKGGTNSTYNLTPACRSCNEKKSNLSLKEFGKLMNKDYSHLEPKALPKDAAIINIRKIIPDTTSHDAWLTKYNRENLNLPKEHYYDALSVGEIPTKFDFSTDKILSISAKGRGSRQMCRMDSYGFPRTSAKASKSFKGFQTGDIVKAVVTRGKKQGTYLGRAIIKSSGYFSIEISGKYVEGINSNYFSLIQRNDGYNYNSFNRSNK